MVVFVAGGRRPFNNSRSRGSLGTGGAHLRGPGLRGSELLGSRLASPPRAPLPPASSHPTRPGDSAPDASSGPQAAISALEVGPRPRGCPCRRVTAARQ